MTTPPWCREKVMVYYYYYYYYSYCIQKGSLMKQITIVIYYQVIFRLSALRNMFYICFLPLKVNCILKEQFLYAVCVFFRECTNIKKIECDYR